MICKVNLFCLSLIINVRDRMALNFINPIQNLPHYRATSSLHTAARKFIRAVHNGRCRIAVNFFIRAHNVEPAAKDKKGLHQHQLLCSPNKRTGCSLFHYHFRPSCVLYCTQFLNRLCYCITKSMSKRRSLGYRDNNDHLHYLILGGNSYKRLRSHFPLILDM